MEEVLFKIVLLLYGGADETHKFSVGKDLGPPSRVEGCGVRFARHDSSTIIQWNVGPSRRVVHFGSILEVHLLWRNDAYNYWVLDLERPGPIGAYRSVSNVYASDVSVIVKAGYLMRNATISENALHLWGDVNTTTTLEVITPIQPGIMNIYFNGQQVEDVSYVDGRLTGTIQYCEPDIDLPDFNTSAWLSLNSLPEIEPEYDDHLWAKADLTASNNTRALTTPTSLYASDYGYHTGSLIYRSRFTAMGNESTLYLLTSGGSTFSHSVWLDSIYLGSWVGDPSVSSHNQTFTLPSPLSSDSDYVIAVLIDHMGLSENTYIGAETVKDPRGILDYNLSGHSSQSDVTWKLTGNFKGESYPDTSRGPRNEGALFAERQGYHLPNASLPNASVKSPIVAGLSGVGVGFFSTTFLLNISSGYDVPLSLVFANASQNMDSAHPAAYRVQIFINGWQFGEYGKNYPLLIFLSFFCLRNDRI